MMRVVKTDVTGEVGEDTLFRFSQVGEMVTAEYHGGKIKFGHLLGLFVGTTLEFRYSQIDIGGRLDSGVSTCEVGRGPDDRIQFLERFEWTSRKGSGINRFQEIFSAV